MMDDAVQPSCAPGVSGGEVRIDPLGKDLCPGTLFQTDGSQVFERDRLQGPCQK